MATWVKLADRKPKQGQWVVVPWGDGFKAGQYDWAHPFSPCVIDRQSGKFYRNFEHWKPLNAPK